jgi:hypothetical protein
MGIALTKDVRRAVHAGRFYAGEAGALRREVETLLAESPRQGYCKTPLALLAPHAGYLYSGAVAAAAYRTIQGSTIDRVLILAPTHTTAFVGAALPGMAAFETPLGEVPVDQKAVDELGLYPHFSVSDEAHAEEHAIEVELPFLQVGLAGPFKILPMTIGDLPDEGLEPIVERLSELIDQRRSRCQRWLIVASSDTYHGYDRRECMANDERLMALLATMDAGKLIAESTRRKVMACGWKGLAVAMMLAERLGARECRVLSHRNSSDVTARGAAADGGRYVVGYVSAAFR